MSWLPPAGPTFSVSGCLATVASGAVLGFWAHGVGGALLGGLIALAGVLILSLRIVAAPPAPPRFEAPPAAPAIPCRCGRTPHVANLQHGERRP